MVHCLCKNSDITVTMIKYFIFALFLYTSVEAYVGIIAEVEKPAKFADQEGCYLPAYDRMIQVENPLLPQDGTSCEKYTCKENKEIHIEGCIARAISDNCEIIPADLSQAYPDCCEKVRCTLPDGKSVVV